MRRELQQFLHSFAFFRNGGENDITANDGFTTAFTLRLRSGQTANTKSGGSL